MPVILLYSGNSSELNYGVRPTFDIEIKHAESRRTDAMELAVPGKGELCVMRGSWQWKLRSVGAEYGCHSQGIVKYSSKRGCRVYTLHAADL